MANTSTPDNRLRVRLYEILLLKRRLQELIDQLKENFFGLAATDPAGALDGDGSAGDPLAVRVDGVTVTINGSNQLEASGSGTPSATVAALDGTGSAGVSTDYSRGDHKHADANRPSDDEKDALVGTGVPSGANPYVTADTLAAAIITPAAHAATHENGGGDEINVGGLSGVLADPQTIDTQADGALDGDGSAGSPLGVRVDGVTIIINGSNELEVVSSEGSPPSGSPANEDVRSITYVIDGGGTTITTGVKGDLSIPFDCQIIGARLLADQTGSIVVDIWKRAYANYPPTVTQTITASATPTISSGVKADDTTLTGWTRTITAGETLRFNVDSCSGIQRVTLTMTVVVG